MMEVEAVLSGTQAECECPICGATCSSKGFLQNDNEEERCCHLRGLSVAGSVFFTFRFDYSSRTMFHYTDLQEIVDALPSRKMRKDMVARLNSTSPQVVHPSEWELVLMDWFGQLGDVEYEVVQPNGKKPDISFCNADMSLSFISDVASVSDSNIDRLYPKWELLREISKVIDDLLEEAIDPHVRIGSSTKENFTMFPPSRLKENVERFADWARERRGEFRVGAELKYQMEQNTLTVTFTPKQRYRSPGGARARLYTKDERYSNPIANALNKKAATQLAPNNERLVGLFVCDADCKLFQTLGRAWNELHFEDILDDVLDGNEHIDFIASLAFYPNVRPHQKPRLDIRLRTPNSVLDDKLPQIEALHELMRDNLGKLKKAVHLPNWSKQLIQNNQDPECYWTFVVR